MNFPGRIIGGTLVAIAVAWILNIAGVFPFNNRGTNQIDATNPNAPKTGTQSFTASNSANRPGTQNYGAVSQNGSATSPAATTTSPASSANSGTANPAVGSTVPAQTPAVRAAW